MGRISPHGQLGALTKTLLCRRSPSALRHESNWTNKKFLDRKCVGGEKTRRDMLRLLKASFDIYRRRH